MTELRVFDVSSSDRRVALHACPNVDHIALTPLECISRPVALLFEKTGCTLWEVLDLLEES